MGHQPMLIMSLLFVHTAHHYYRLNGPVKSLDLTNDSLLLIFFSLVAFLFYILITLLFLLVFINHFYYIYFTGQRKTRADVWYTEKLCPEAAIYELWGRCWLAAVSSGAGKQLERHCDKFFCKCPYIESQYYCTLYQLPLHGFVFC